MNPEVSVIMAAFNAERYIKKAVESIIRQTFKNWEMIIVDDYSDDATADIAREYEKKEKRIKVLRNGKRAGPAVSRNRAIKISTGKYIVVMDSDDIAMPERIEKQVKYMNENPKAAVAGSNAAVIDSENRITGFLIYPCNDRELRGLLCRRNTLCHSSAVIRREAMEAAGFYDEDFYYAQDYRLWLSMPENYEIRNINEVLQAWRENPAGISSGKEAVQLKFVIKAKLKAIREKRIPLWKGVYIIKDVIVAALPGFFKNFIRKKFTDKIKRRKKLNYVNKKRRRELNRKLL